MALNAHLWLEGETSGPVQGDVTQAGREGSIMVIATSQTSQVNETEAGPVPTHQPLTITKEIDKSSPLLAAMLQSGETLTLFRLEFWRPSRTGVEVQYYTIELSNATVTGIRTEQLNNKYPENMRHAEREHVSFSYGAITRRFEDGGIESTQTNPA